MADYLLPDVGEGLTEAEIVSWKVKVGDVIAVNDVVVEIETAKSLVELPSPYAGTVTALLVAEGETVPVGTPIISIGSGEPQEMEIDLSNPAASGSGEGESLVGRIKAERGATRRARRRGGADEAGRVTAKATVQDTFNPGADSQFEAVDQLVDTLITDVPADPPPPPATVVPVAAPAEVRALAKPPVRRLAKDLGVDLAGIAGSGPHGSITREDVQAAGRDTGRVPRPHSTGEDAGRVAPSADLPAGRVAPSASEGRIETREPIKGVRKMMAQAMVSSAFSAPHVTEWITVDATRTMELCERLRARREWREVKVSPLLVLARAVMLAIRRTPELNSYWDEQAQEVVYKSYVNLGIAAATPRGLVVPNIKDAERLGLRDLADALGDLAATAREGRTQPADMSGGTFTITNVGVFGVDAGTPIINPGESAILCFGAVRKQPWVVSGPDGDRIEPRQITTLALSFDHRHIDGELGSRFLADVAGILEDPATALLF